MNKKNVFVAGHQGMVGSAIVRLLNKRTDITLIYKDHYQLDLTRQNKVMDFFKSKKIEEVYLTAAKVGGILANNTYPADFIYENLMIECNVIHAAHTTDVNKLLFLGSSCIYPKAARQPMSEDELLTGKLEATNEPYAVAKIAGIKLCESYNRQYNRDYRSVMPTNLYGENDNFHPENSHVIPALIGRIHAAKMTNAKNVVVWGTGKPMREFLHVNDLASACIYVMELPLEKYNTATRPSQSFLNIGTGKEISILQLTKMIASVVGYNGDVKFDTSKPDGTMRKLLDIGRISSLGWSPVISLEEGLNMTYKWYVDNNKFIRG